MWRGIRLTSTLFACLLAVALGACTSSSAPRPTFTIGNTATPNPTPDASLRILDMQLVAPDVGWVQLQSRLLWTEDGGQNWTEIALPKPVQGERFGVFFLDNKNGWLSHVRPGPNGLDSPSTVEIYRTTDGAEHWQESSIEGPSVPIGYAGPPSFGGVVRFVDPDNGWFDGTRRGGTLTSPWTYRTVDGGATWVGASPSFGGGLGHSSTFLSPTEAWMTEIDGGLFRTEDGGVSWQPVQLPFPTSCEERSAGYFDPPSFLNSAEAVVQVRQRCADLSGTAFYATQDGGDSWEFAAYRENAYETYVIAPETWLDHREDAVYITTDAGRVWTDVSETWLPVLPAANTVTLEFVDADNGWVMTGRSSLFATNDGGRTWETLRPE